MVFAHACGQKAKVHRYVVVVGPGLRYIIPYVQHRWDGGISDARLPISPCSWQFSSVGPPPPNSFSLCPLFKLFNLEDNCVMNHIYKRPGSFAALINTVHSPASAIKTDITHSDVCWKVCWRVQTERTTEVEHVA